MKSVRISAARSAAIVVLLGALAFGCAQEIVEEEFEPSESHQRYRDGLDRLGLLETALGRDWAEAAEAALRSPIEVELPFFEAAVFEASRAEAVGYRFPARQGQRITVTLEFEEVNRSGGAAELVDYTDEVLPGEGESGTYDGLRVFADVFRVEDDRSEPLEQVASYSEARNLLEFEPRRDREYILRLQPELLRGGRINLTIETGPSLIFPVEGHGTDHIYSFFGAPRDGGARRHEGVDVFAPRGTPVLAPSAAVVRRVGTRERGGRIVSLYDEKRDLIYYYAHLDEQLIESGVRVEPGDVLGTVGNTGNARTTPPHLHFGIYEARWNAVDPWYYLYDKGGEPMPPPREHDLIGEWKQVSTGEATVFDSLVGSRRALGTLEPEAVIQTVGAAGQYFRVRLAHGGFGYVNASVLTADSTAEAGANGG